jgi:hypothetical protein
MLEFLLVAQPWAVDQLLLIVVAFANAMFG